MFILHGRVVLPGHRFTGSGFDLLEEQKMLSGSDPLEEEKTDPAIKEKWIRFNNILINNIFDNEYCKKSSNLEEF